MRNLLLIPTLCITFLLQGCSKHRYPYIKVFTPLAMDVYNAPDVVHVEANMWDADALSEETLLVTKVNSTHDTLINFYDDRFVAGGPWHYELRDSFVSEPNTTYKIVIGAVGHGKWVYDSVTVKVN